MESNMSWIDVDGIAGLLSVRRFGRLEVARDPSSGKYGVKTGAHEKKMYAMQVGHYLKLNQLTAAKHMFGEDPARDMLLLYQQMDRFRMEVKESSMPGEKPKVVYTGKGSGSQSDDILLALMINLWHAAAYFKTNLYKNYMSGVRRTRQQRRWR